MMIKRTSDFLPRIPRRRSSGNIDLDDFQVEDLISSLPQEKQPCIDSTSECTFRDDDDMFSLVESSCSESSHTVGRWSSSSSLEYYYGEDDDAAPPRSPRLKNVRFSTVQVREYAICQGDHPHCEVPMTLDWAHSETEVNHIEAYESMRMLHKTTRSSHPRRLSLEERENRIRELCNIASSPS